jgi:hypothetical protein
MAVAMSRRRRVNSDAGLIMLCFQGIFELIGTFFKIAFAPLKSKPVRGRSGRRRRRR